ncbi:MAG: TatD family hydrolase [Patescibacteria group bacterium]
MIDSHCHLADPAFDHDREAVLERAKTAGITHCVVIADSIESAEKGITLAKRFPAMLSASIGVHPHKASEWNEKSDMKLREFASDKSVVAIGEIDRVTSENAVRFFGISGATGQD